MKLPTLFSPTTIGGKVMQKFIQGLVANAAHGVDWKSMMMRSEFALKLLAKPETQQLMAAALQMREPLAQVLLAEGVITEMEAAASKDGGLGLMELVRRLMEEDKRRNLEKEDSDD